MSNQKQNNRPRGPMGHGMRGGGEKAKDFKGTMKKLFNYIKPFKFTFLIGILCAVVSVCIMVIGPKIQGNIITEINGNKVKSLNDIQDVIYEKKKGEKVELTIKYVSGRQYKEKKVNVELS